MDAIKHLRIPFSLFLMPVYWFAWSNAPFVGWTEGIIVFLAIHLFAYPASNGYNSYFDRDEGSIGGLRNPPKVSKSLFYWVIAFDLIAVGLGLILSWEFALMLTVYLLVSKAYSWDKIRLKKYPIISTVVVTLFQGAFTYFMVWVGFGMPWEWVLHPVNIAFAGTATLLLAGSYPLTQVYQHEEDSKRGDRTLSLMLGIKGTFVFAGILLLMGMALLLGLYFGLGIWQRGLLFLGITSPVGYIFSKWITEVWKDPKAANFDQAMLMNKVSSVCTSLAFLAAGFL